MSSHAIVGGGRRVAFVRVGCFDEWRLTVGAAASDVDDATESGLLVLLLVLVVLLGADVRRGLDDDGTPATGGSSTPDPPVDSDGGACDWGR